MTASRAGAGVVPRPIAATAKRTSTATRMASALSRLIRPDQTNAISTALNVQVGKDLA